MHRLLFAAGAILAAALTVSLSAPACAAAAQNQEPTLLGLITTRLGMVAELRPTAGVRITAATFSRGVVRVVGTVISEAQRERVKREVEGLRARIRSELDLRVTEIDVSGVTVIPKPRPEDGQPEQPKTKPEERRPVYPPTVTGAPWPPAPVYGYPYPYGCCPPIMLRPVYLPGGPYPPGPPLWDPIKYGPWGP